MAGNTDKALVLSVLSGNADAYGEIVRKYKNSVFRTILGIVKNYHTAEDIAQDTFVDGYIKIKSLTEPYNAGAWLTKIAKNKCFNYITRSALRHERTLHDYIPDTHAPSPEHSLLAQHERDTLAASVSRLPDIHKTVAILFYYHHFTLEQIAARLRIPPGTVKSRLNTARKKLRAYTVISEQARNKELNQMEKLPRDFDKKVTEKIKDLSNYYRLHNDSYDGFESEFEKTLKLIACMPDSKEKHGAYADAYWAAYDATYRTKFQNKEYEKDALQKRALEEAERAEKAGIVADIMINMYLNAFDKKEEFIKKADEALVKIKNMPDSDDPAGSLLFWRGVTHTRLKNYEAARNDFTEAEKRLNHDNSYHTNAVAGTKLIDVIGNEPEKYLFGPIAANGEVYKLSADGTRLEFWQQPGFTDDHGPLSGKTEYNSTYYFAAGMKKSRIFFDTTAPEGEAFEEDTLVLAKKATVTVPAGTFENCLHVQSHADPEFWRNTVSETWYAPNVGIVKCRIYNSKGGTDETYELQEYRATGGGYFPAEVGNRWRYRNAALPESYCQTEEYEVISLFDNAETGGKNVYVSHTHALMAPREDCDSETHIALAAEALPSVNPWEQTTATWDFETAFTHLKLAVQKNTSAKAAQFALHALDFVARGREHRNRGWHFLLRRAAGRLVRKAPSTDIVYTTGHKSQGAYTIGPGTKWAEMEHGKKCLGLQPLRFLDALAGTLYSPKWTPGYTEALEHGFTKSKGHLSVEEGGTIAVKAGTFENTLKITIILENGEMLVANPDYYHTTPNASATYYFCGTKHYWYAPNVGIVKHDCIWGANLNTAFELSEYKSTATSGEYMPLYVGSQWTYDETTLPDTFLARTRYTVPGGIGDEFFVISELEMLYKGSREAYEKCNQTS